MKKNSHLISALTLITWVLCNLFSITIHAQCTHPDYNALMAFYTSTNGDNWDDNTGWYDGFHNGNCNICEWSGIECNDSNRVEKIRKWGENLVGTIPTAFGNLNELKRLELPFNQLTGNIPSGLSDLNSLEELDLSSNQLVGSIPPEIGNITSLSVLRLGSNLLSGTIPVELENLTNLTDLSLHYNQLSGNIPDEIGNLALSFLELSGNNLSGCIPQNLIENCSTYYILDLSYNPLLPYEGNLDLLCNDAIQIGGFCEIDNDYETQEYIQEDCTCGIDNPIACAEPYLLIDSVCISDDLFELTFTVFESIVNNTTNTYYLDGDCPTQFLTEGEAFSYIFYGSTAPNNLAFTASLINNIDCLTAAEINKPVGCDDVQLEYPTSDCHPDYNSLMALYASTNGDNWTDNTGWYDGFHNGNCNVCEWAGIGCHADNRVRNLNLADNNLTGILLPELSGLDSLRHLNVVANLLSGEIPVEIGNLSKLEYLNLTDNNIVGTIPIELANLSNLSSLSLASNKLSGEIPTELTNLSNLTKLFIHNNELSGEIPAELGNMVNLEFLFLGSNELTGEIPTELGNLPNLNQLFLPSNNLSGEIPASLGNLNPWSISLNNNQLSGCIPQEVLDLCESSSIYFSNNPRLPYEGDTELLCNDEPQIGAPCDEDNNSETQEYIQEDCTCGIDANNNGNNSNPLINITMPPGICENESFDLQIYIDSLPPFSRVILEYNGNTQEELYYSEGNIVAAQNEVFISEMLINAVTDGDCGEGLTFDSTPEWIELSATPGMDLSCYFLTDGEQVLSFPSGSIVPNDGLFTIGNNCSSSSNIDLNLDNCECLYFSATENSGNSYYLNNNGDCLAIFDNEGNFIEQVCWLNEFTFGGISDTPNLTECGLSELPNNLTTNTIYSGYITEGQSVVKTENGWQPSNFTNNQYEGIGVINDGQLSYNGTPAYSIGENDVFIYHTLLSDNNCDENKELEVIISVNNSNYYSEPLNYFLECNSFSSCEDIQICEGDTGSSLEFTGWLANNISDFSLLAIEFSINGIEQPTVLLYEYYPTISGTYEIINIEDPFGVFENLPYCHAFEPFEVTINSSVLTWYADNDNDGFGDVNNSITDCEQPEGYVANNTDDNDSIATSNTELPTQYHLSIYPNPVAHHINLSYNVLKTSEITLRIYDVSGRLIHQDNVTALTGINRLNINASNYASGLYFLKLSGNTYNQQSTFIVN